MVPPHDDHIPSIQHDLKPVAEVVGGVRSPLVCVKFLLATMASVPANASRLDYYVILTFTAELLDILACQVVANGWRTGPKSFH